MFLNAKTPTHKDKPCKDPRAAEGWRTLSRKRQQVVRDHIVCARVDARSVKKKSLLFILSLCLFI